MIEKTQIVGVIGRDFCGSTLLLRLMSSVKGVEGAGELHWLLSIPHGGTVMTRAGWLISRKCVQCGVNCPVFTEEFLAQRIAPSALYQAVAQKMNARVLVVSDKRPRHYSSMAKSGDIDGIVMFKMPESAVMSDIRRERRSVVQSVTGYVELYKKIIEWAPRFCKRTLYLLYEDLAKKPVTMTKRVLENLGIDGEMAHGYSEIDHHHIGGNPDAHRKKKVVLDDKWKRGLSVEQKNYIKQHKSCQEIYHKLMQKRLMSEDG